jgi:hypothetical protein
LVFVLQSVPFHWLHLFCPWATSPIFPFTWYILSIPFHLYYIRQSCVLSFHIWHFFLAVFFLNLSYVRQNCILVFYIKQNWMLAYIYVLLSGKTEFLHFIYMLKSCYM